MSEDEQDLIAVRLLRQRKAQRELTLRLRERLNQMAASLQEAGRRVAEYAATSNNHHLVAASIGAEPLENCDLEAITKAVEQYRRAAQELSELEGRAAALGI